MSKRTAFITGVSGEVGQGLVRRLREAGNFNIVGLDVIEFDTKTEGMVDEFWQMDIWDPGLENKMRRLRPNMVFHLAAILSTAAELDIWKAQAVNVEGTIKLLSWCGRGTKFVFPSSIAAYGFSNLEEKSQAGAVHEDEFTKPVTLYGCQKLFGENLGRYFARKSGIDFRCVRFPGLISAETLPTGGTSDYAPQMVNAAAKRESYTCFARNDTQIPFMAMADGVRALVELAEAQPEKLSRRVYNVAGFSARADEIAGVAGEVFGEFEVRYEVDEKRQVILDSWPQALDDGAAQGDWGWRPEYDLEKTVRAYEVVK